MSTTETANFVTPSEEYAKLLRILSNEKDDDIYQKLVGIENNSLLSINRVIEYEQKKSNEGTLFYNMPVINVVAIFANTWKNIFLELLVYRNAKDVSSLWQIFTKKDRKVYVGLMLGFVALFVYMVDIL